MIWNRFQLAFSLGPLLFGGWFFGCSSDAPQATGAAGAVAMSVGGTGGSAGLLASAGATVAGAPSAGAAGAAGSGGASGGTGGSGSAGTSSSPCHPRPGLLFCDDFEAAAPGSAAAAPWSVGLIGDGGLVEVEASASAHSGSKSVHVHGAGYQALLVYHDAAILPQTSGRFFVRAYLRLAEAMTGGHNTFLLADTFAAPNVGNALRVGEQNAMLMMTVGGDAHGYLSNQNFYNDGKLGAVIPPQTYGCLELLLDSPKTEIQVWLDGVDVTDLHVTDLAHENYDALRFGFEKYAGPESDLWFDDIAIGSERIGCD